MREGRKRRQPQRFGMPTQLIWGLDRDPLAIAFDFVRPRVIKQIGGQPEPANQVELGQLGLQAVDARPARIGAQMHQHGRNEAVWLDRLPESSALLRRPGLKQSVEPGSMADGNRR